MANREERDLLEVGEFAKKKRKVNSRRKGSNFERGIAKKLNGRFNTEEFMRSPGSGAFATTHKLPQHIKVHGDLITPQNFAFVIECKNGYKLELDDPFRRKSDFWSFIKQAERDSQASGKDMMVIYKKNARMELVIVDKPYPINDEMVVNKKYYIYNLKDFLALDDVYFFRA